MGAAVGKGDRGDRRAQVERPHIVLRPPDAVKPQAEIPKILEGPQAHRIPLELPHAAGGPVILPVFQERVDIDNRLAIVINGVPAVIPGDAGAAGPERFIVELNPLPRYPAKNFGAQISVPDREGLLFPSGVILPRGMTVTQDKRTVPKRLRRISFHKAVIFLYKITLI